MREIDFRAWDGTSMIYDMCMTVDMGDGKNFVVNFHTWPDYIFLQYIGLSDKFGKKIYEGDIVQDVSGWIGYGEKIRAVEYWEATFYPFDGSDYGFDCDECVIIGNIYENPRIIRKGD